LEADGVAGRETLAALNVPAAERVRGLLVNLERWRWLPQELGERHVMVNIAGFHLDLVDGGRSVLDMKVIVGRSYRRTPVFSDRIRYLVFNPQWEVPRKLALQDVLPRVREDTAYLEHKGFRVLEGWGADERVVDPATVDWASLGPDHWPYRFRQKPGPTNSLGVVKFMFPNKFDVYLHDTPAKDLFASSKRSFSSGCIRVERALDLAEALLKDDPGWTRERIDATVGAERERTVALRAPVPVHLQYWTAWADEDGSIEFREDLYRRDARVAKALRIEAPGS
ncbi:MAG: L,D-transpeptidase family protein, partial [Myxococcales bacterium]|nr:L,D-transpeptidase family protein [Myxococcales bacterium]